MERAQTGTPAPAIKPLLPRRMRSEHVEAVAEIEARSYPDAWPLESFSEWLELPACGANVLVEPSQSDGKKDTVAGFILYEVVRKRMHIANVAVSPDFRRRGVASDLILHVMKLGRKLHKVRVTLEVRKSNASAISLYKHLGFVKKRTIKAYYEDGEDGLFMEATL